MPFDLPPPPYVSPALPQRARCNGETVSAVLIRSHRPSAITAAERAGAATTEVIGLGRGTTEPFVIRAYLQLKAGDICTEQKRADSERMLRAQRFVASAAVTVIPDGPGRVRIRVDVVDELALVGGLRLKGGGLRAFHIGTENWRGRGTTIIVGGERLEAYRPGATFIIGQSGFLDRPALGDIEVRHRPLGGLARVSYAEPFLTDGQPYALYSSLVHETTFALLVRPGQQDAAVRTQRAAYYAGWIRRVGVFSRTRAVGLAGLMVLGTDVRTGDQVVEITDSGLVVTPDSVLEGRYPAYGVGRLAAMAGFRALRFRTMHRLEALRAAEDVGVGVQLNSLVGPSVALSGRARDLLMAGDLYIGMGGTRSFAALNARAEGRRDSEGDWQGLVGGASLSWHRLPSERRTRVFSLSAATVERMVFPVQLTFRDPEGGLIGAPSARDAGGRRIVGRVEERWVLGWPRRRASIAFAAFADAGKLWAGDVPFGQTTPIRGSLGVSLLTAFPAGGKRIYRVDFALPVNPGPGGSTFAIRFQSADRTGAFWREAHDVARARSGTGPVTMLRW
jgi:hypothetical protein